MRIVDIVVCRHFPRVPAKACVAARTPHLIAPREFEDHHAASRTSLGLFTDKVSRKYILRLACMLYVFMGYLETLGT